MPLSATEHPWVVLVEDDESLERELRSALSRALPEVALHCTGDADHALELVNDTRSRLLITEAQSAAVDGLTLARCARLSRATLPLIFFLGDTSSVSRARLLSFDDAHCLEKPPELQKFVNLVARILDAPAGFRGEVRSHDLVELVQLVAMTNPTGALHLWAKEGQGTLWFEDGMIVHVSSPPDEGVSAFRRMLTWTGGDFGVEARALAPTRTITLTTTQLLLEGTRLLDEESASSRPDHSGTQLMPRSAVEHFERGLEAVHEKRYGDALPEWERATLLEPSNRVYQHNLRRLRDLLSLGRGHKAIGGRE